MTRDTRDSEYYRRIGRMGGKATVAKHGKAHMSEIGRKGFDATTSKYFASEAHHKAWLAEMAGYVYWQSTGIAMRYDWQGLPVWTEEKPAHPAHK